MLDINAHIDQGCTGIEFAFLASVTELKRTALAIRHEDISNRNNEKYIDRRSNFATTGKKIMNEF